MVRDQLDSQTREQRDTRLIDPTIRRTSFTYITPWRTTVKPSKHIKQLKRREALKLNHHIESLGAAFCRETGLNPRDTALITSSDDKGMYYYFTAKPEPLDVDGLPPQMRELFDLNVMLDRAITAADEEGVSACLGSISAFMAGLK